MVHLKKGLVFVMVGWLVGSSLACTAPARPANDRGGVDFTPDDVLGGAELGPLDSCDACCVEDHQLPWCTDPGGGGAAGEHGGEGGLPFPSPGCHQGACYWVGTHWQCYEVCAPGGGTGSWPRVGGAGDGTQPLTPSARR